MTPPPLLRRLCGKNTEKRRANPLIADSPVFQTEKEVVG
jgi:hypothetical protein